VGFLVNTEADKFLVFITVYALWTSSGGGGSGTPYYTVGFITNGGSAVASESLAAGSKLAKPIDPTREGYTFTGWYTDVACSAPYDFSTKVTKNLTLYAGWEEGQEPWDNPFTDVREVNCASFTSFATL
jgi:uncharacterized repeat protein (TIGR02543 family)